MDHRPHNLQEVAERAVDLDAWFLHLRDWLDELAWRRSQQGNLAQLIDSEPKLLREVFAGGAVADAFAAGLAALVARQHGLSVPAWTQNEARVLDDPWFPVQGTPALHAWLLRETPPEFKNRNVFIDERSLQRV